MGVGGLEVKQKRILIRSWSTDEMRYEVGPTVYEQKRNRKTRQLDTSEDIQINLDSNYRNGTGDVQKIHYGQTKRPIERKSTEKDPSMPNCCDDKQRRINHVAHASIETGLLMHKALKL